MKTLLSVNVSQITDLLVLRVFDQEVNKTKIITVDDFFGTFYIKEHKHIEELKKLSNFIIVKKIDSKCFSTYYTDSTDVFYQIRVLKYVNMEYVMSNVRKYGFELYEADVDLKNQFLLTTGLKIGSDFKMDDTLSHKEIEVFHSFTETTSRILYFSISVQNKDDKVPIARWTQRLADYYDYDIAEVLYNPITNPISVISTLHVLDGKRTLRIYKIGEEKVDIVENINDFNSNFKGEELQDVLIYSFEDELSMIRRFVGDVLIVKPHYFMGWNIDSDIYYIRERLVFLTKKPTIDDLYSSDIYLFYNAFTGFDTPFINYSELFIKYLHKNLESIYHYECNDESWIISIMKCTIEIIDLETVWYSKLNNNSENKKGYSLESVFKTIFGKQIIISNKTTTNTCIYQAKRVVQMALINEKKDVLSNIMEVCKNIPITVDQVISRGQSCRIKHKLLEYIHKEGMLLKTMNNWGKEEEHFDGGYVLQPDVVGLERDKIVEFDFVSYYPSIMIDFNVCFTTLVSASSNIPEELTKNGDDYTFIYIEDVVYVFVKKHIKEGIFPKMCKEFLTKRYDVKKQKQSIKDNSSNGFKKLEIEEKMLKDFINSIFGVSSSYLFEHVKIGSVITFIGKFLNIYVSELIRRTSVDDENSIKIPDYEKIKVFHNFWDESDYLKNRVLGNSMSITYADTDSIFIKHLFTSENDVYTKQQLSVSLCSKLNDIFKDQFGDNCYLKLEYKSILLSSFWLQMKHYYCIPLKRMVGSWEEDKEIYKECVGQVESKGSVLVKSDKLLFEKKIVDAIMKKLFTLDNMMGTVDIGYCIDSIYEYLVKEVPNLLEESEIRLSEWLISNKVKKEVSQYRGNTLPPHIKMIQYLSFVEKEVFVKPSINQNIQTVFYNGDIKETANDEEQRREQRKNITSPYFLLKKKQIINIGYNIECFRTDLTLILSSLFKERKSEEETKDAIDTIFTTLLPNKKKRSYTSLFQIDTYNKEHIEHCKECIKTNQLEIEDIGQCSNYSCSIKQDQEYRSYNFGQ